MRNLSSWEQLGYLGLAGSMGGLLVAAYVSRAGCSIAIVVLERSRRNVLTPPNDEARAGPPR